MSQDNAEHDKNKPFHIEVNGRDKEVTGPNIDYDQLVALAFPDTPTAECTISYTGPHIADGSVAKTQSVELLNGMKFIVTKTNRS